MWCVSPCRSLKLWIFLYILFPKLPRFTAYLCGSKKFIQRLTGFLSFFFRCLDWSGIFGFFMLEFINFIFQAMISVQLKRVIEKTRFSRKHFNLNQQLSFTKKDEEEKKKNFFCSMFLYSGGNDYWKLVYIYCISCLKINKFV